MGCAVPYALGAKFGHPDRPVVAFVGDGAMQMNGLAELLTIHRYRTEWDELPFVVCVFGNGDLNQVTWELRAMGGAPKFEESQSLPAVSYAEVARAMGIDAMTVAADDELGNAWGGRCPRPARHCWTCGAIRRYRRYRRTSRWTRC